MIIPFELEHINHLPEPEMEWAELGSVVLYGRTFIEKGKITGYGGVSLHGKYAVAFIKITDELKKKKYSLIKETKKQMKLIVNEGYEILAVAQTQTQRRFLGYLGFIDPELFINKGRNFARYRLQVDYDS